MHKAASSDSKLISLNISAMTVSDSRSEEIDISANTLTEMIPSFQEV